jgi:hypothetical protein
MDHGTVHGMSPFEAEAEKDETRTPRRKSRRKRLTKRGICFTYATMFALESLAIAGETHENSAAVRRACDFLVSKQMEDGGWGETYMVSIPASTLLTLRSSILFDPISSILPLSVLTIISSLALSLVSSLTLGSHAYQWNTPNIPNLKSSKLPGQSSH